MSRVARGGGGACAICSGDQTIGGNGKPFAGGMGGHATEPSRETSTYDGHEPGRGVVPHFAAAATPV